LLYDGRIIALLLRVSGRRDLDRSALGLSMTLRAE